MGGTVETKHIDKLKLLLWADQKELSDNLIEEMKKAKIVCQKSTTGDDWVSRLQKNNYHVGAIIMTPENFDHVMTLVQKLRLLNQEIPLFIFSSTKESANLLTEAEENGVNDHFYLPLDIDLLATKLGRYFFQSDLQKLQLGLSSVPAEKSNARLILKSHVTEIDENGITFRGPHMLTKGAVVKIQNSDILFFLGMDEISLVVEKSWAEDDNTFSAYAEWKKDPEGMASAVRKWSLEMKR